jgi:predicted nucleotidyltransferase
MAAADSITSMTHRIVQKFDPERIILFGSQARGDAEANSDIDLLVVFSQLLDKRRMSVEIRRALAGFPVCKDIFVATPEEIERRRNLVGDVVRFALREGKVIYERSQSA